MTPRARTLVLILGLGFSLVVFASMTACGSPEPGPEPVSVTPPVLERVPAYVSPSPPEPIPPVPLPVAVNGPTPSPDIGAGEFVVPGVQLTVPLGTTSVVGGAVNPPTIGSAYLIDGYGTPHGHGTAYVALHSGRGTDAAGNALFDIASGLPTVHAGAAIIVDGVHYAVTDVRLVKKADVVIDHDIWRQQDGRLIVFTCLQRSAGKSLQNVVIIGERVS